MSRVVENVVELNDSSKLKSTRHTRSRFARHLENIPKGGCRFCQIVRLVAADVDPSYRKSICKTLREYSASNYEGGLEMLSNRLESNDSSQLMSNRHTSGV